MKKILLFFVFFPTLLVAQKKFFVEPIINPLLLPVGDTGFEEYGLGYSNFEYKENSTQEYVLLIGKYLFGEKWNAGIGVSHKKYRTDFNYVIRNPLASENILREKEGFLDYSFFGLRLFTSYQISEKFNARLTIEANDPYNVNKNITTNLGRLELIIIEVDGEYIGTFTDTNEFVTPAGGPYSYVIPEFNFSYTIYKKLNLLVGVKYKFYKRENQWNYRLQINENGDGIPENIRVLNDSRIYPKFLFLYTGISYQFGFGKQKRRKEKKP